MSLKFPTSDSELKTIVRAETSYEDTTDELPSSQLDTIVERAKAKIELRTSSTNWYNDDGLGFALAAYTCLRAKAAVENVPLSDYSLGDEQLSFDPDNPDSSQQLNQWAKDVRDGLNASSASLSNNPQPTNTSEYIGENYIHTEHDRDGGYP